MSIYSHIPKEDRKRFIALIKAVLDLIIHFTIDELQMLHDSIKNIKE
ncbi:MAG: hypothetical protein [Microvirus sp.]|nr:MAG: hypothetical protein [Microvirus sp.]